MNMSLPRRTLAVTLSLLILSAWLLTDANEAGAAPGGSVLYAGEQLLVGQSLRSPNGHYSLLLQSDGNLVLYGPGGGPTGAIWASYTNSGARLAMQGDGNLVLYKSNNTFAGFASWTQAYPGAWAQLQDDGNLVVYSPGAIARFWTGVANPYPDLLINHNIAGNHSPSGNVEVHMRMTYQRMSLAGLPYTITLEEVCGNQAFTFASNLNTLAPGQYQTRFNNNYKDANGVAQNPSGTCTGGYGNVVATRASGYSPQVAEATYAGSQVGYESKGYICVEGGVGSPNHFACSTHFWPSTAGANWTQAQKGAALLTFKASMDYLFAYRGRVVSGMDIYLSRSAMSTEIPGIFNTWKDSFDCATWTDNSGTVGPNYSLQADHILTRGTSCAGRSGYLLHRPDKPAPATVEYWEGSDHKLMFSRGTL